MRATLLFIFLLVPSAMADERGAVLGVVRDAQTQQPIEGAKVHLSPYDLHSPDPSFPTLQLTSDSLAGFETTTDAAGRYHFSDLPPHRYCLTADKQGYWVSDDEICQLSMIRTRAGRSAERDLALDRAASLRGRFLDRATNAPIAGLRVVVLQHKYAGGTRQWTSSFGMKAGKSVGEFEVLPPRGEFYLEIVSNETEKIAVRADRTVSSRPFYGRSYYPGVMDIASATPIVLAPGEERILEIRLARQNPITVSVEIAGAPKDSHIQLALERRTAGYFPPSLANASVKARDPIQIEGLSATEYTLIAWTNDLAGPRLGSVQRFSAGNGDSNLKLDLQPTLTLQGVVHIDDSPGAELGEGSFSMSAADRANPQEGFSRAEIKGGGNFHVDGLFPGEFQVYAGPPPGWVVSKIQHGGLDAIHQIFTLDAASTEVEITLSRAFGLVTGSVTDGNGPMDNAIVVLVPEPMPENPYVYSFPWAHLDESGRYEFRNVVAGRYRVIPFYGSTLTVYHDLQALREHVRGYRDVGVLPGKTSTGIDFTSHQ